MFQTQVKICEQDNLPPFLRSNTGFREVNLLHTTNYCRDGKQRLPTPDKMAIMELSNSFQKRRLGKQQRILSDITRRCREQDVTDLSSVLSSKCTLKGQDKEEQPIENTKSKLILTKRPSSDPSSQNSRVEASYKSFPVRKIIKKARNDLHRPPLLRSRTTLTQDSGVGVKPIGAQTDRQTSSSRKVPSPSTVTTPYSKPPERIIFCTSRIDPEPRSKNLDKNSISTRSQKSTKESEQDQASIAEGTGGEERGQY
ncbi:hypothetical protein SNE40_018618 [Patella caerulea]|uniref:Uncharacterized protein n=1 Tax=Patella caerulea TaxID=87958 RepID=A0AAN8J701_PATCE